jgi:hypothetical protein
MQQHLVRSHFSYRNNIMTEVREVNDGDKTPRTTYPGIQLYFV